MYILSGITEVTFFITDIIKKVFQGLYYLFSFIIEFFDYCVDIFSSLPSSLGAILISVVTISFVVIIYKVIHS